MTLVCGGEEISLWFKNSPSQLCWEWGLRNPRRTAARDTSQWSSICSTGGTWLPLYVHGWTLDIPVNLYWRKLLYFTRFLCQLWMPQSPSTHCAFVREREQRLILDFEARDPRTHTSPEGEKMGFPKQKGDKPEKCYLSQRPIKGIIQQKVRISSTFLCPFKGTCSKKQWDV